MICFNTDCNYPFGTACGPCVAELEARALARALAREQKMVREYADANANANVNANVDANVNANANANANANPNAGTGLKSQAESQQDHDDISERIADIIEDLQAIFVFAPQQAPKRMEPSELTWLNLQTQALIPGPLNPSAPSRSGSVDAEYDGINPALIPMVESWLNELLKNTLDGLMIKTSFTGGADEEDEPEDDCPYCGISMIKQWKELHLLQCKYAHEEAEKLEIAKARLAKRRNP